MVRAWGRGGMGTVYLAQDQRLRTTVALKETLFTKENHLRKAFEREANLLASLRHSALPKVSDHFSEGEGQFLVMEYIVGEDLGELLEQRKSAFPVEEVLGWADQLLDALDHLHSQDPPVIHRDIKPQNLKLTKKGQIILLDFGLAKGSLSQMTRVTNNVSLVGYTPNYAPLEQIQGGGTDGRSDLYSLAATFYHLMTYTKPPDALARAGAVIAGQSDPIRPPHELNASVPPAVSAVMLRALSQNRNARPATAAEMRSALREAGQARLPITQPGPQNAATIPPPSNFYHVQNSDPQQPNTHPTVPAPGADLRRFNQQQPPNQQQHPQQQFTQQQYNQQQANQQQHFAQQQFYPNQQQIRQPPSGPHFGAAPRKSYAIYWIFGGLVAVFGMILVAAVVYAVWPGSGGSTPSASPTPSTRTSPTPRATPSPSLSERLENTTWSGTDSDRDTLRFDFSSGGRLRVTDQAGRSSTGTWRVSGSSITMTASTLTWRGTVRENEMSGTGSRSTDGHTWTWTITRGAGTSPPPSSLPTPNRNNNNDNEEFTNLPP